MTVPQPPSAPHPHEAGFSAGGRRAAAVSAPARDDAAGDGATQRGLLLASVARDARLDAKFLLLIVLATAIATLGLLQDSPAVVIGAMLVSPLLGPIMGIGFGLATIESGLLKRSAGTLLAGIALAIVVAMLIVWLSPVQDVTDELRARTQPTLLDLAVAIVGGIAGVYAILRNLSGVMVGVAIATALVPPLSTIGYGLATARPDFAMGAALLFLTNTLAIAFAATAVARLNRFGPSMTPQHSVLQVVGIVVTLGVLAVPLALSLNGIVSEVRARAVVQNALADVIGSGGRVDTLTVDAQGEQVAVDAVVLVDRFDPDLRARLQGAVRRQLDRPVSVTLAQLRRETRVGVEQQDSINQRLTALERRDADSQGLLTLLTTGDLIARDRITLDPQVRRVQISLGADDEPQALTAALEPLIIRARADYPDWVIESVAAANAPSPAE